MVAAGQGTGERGEREREREAARYATPGGRKRNAQWQPRRRLTPQNHSGIAPCLILAGVNAYNLWNEHWEHWSHMPPLEERVEYPYQNIRTKNFPWGDGDKTIFWNDSVNYHNKDKAT